MAGFCMAEQPADLTTKSTVRKRDDEIYFQVDTVYRGKDPILRTSRIKDRNGKFRVMRTYEVGGDTIMMETDGSDGGPPTIILYNHAKSKMEVFERQSDGSVKPVSTDELEKHKKIGAIFEEFWDKAMKEGGDNPSESIKDTKKKLQDLEKSKSSDTSKPNEQ